MSWSSALRAPTATRASIAPKVAGLDHSHGGTGGRRPGSLERGVLAVAAQDRAPSSLWTVESHRNHVHPHVTPELPPIGTTIVYEGRAYRFCGVTPVIIQPT